MKSWGLRFEIIVSLVLLVAAAAGIMGVVVYQFTKQEAISLRSENGLLLAKTIEARWRTLGFADIKNGVTSGAFSDFGFNHLAVTDRSGAILVSTQSWPWPNGPSRADILLALSSGEVQTRTFGADLFAWGKKPGLSVAVPLSGPVRVKGVAVMYSDLEDLQGTWSRTRNIILTYLALDTLIAVAFGAYLLSMRLVRPLRRMVDRVEALEQGRYLPGQNALNAGHEIGRLETAFEKMAQRILDGQARLEKNLESLKQTQESLIRSEKLATVGWLGAGLAHELGNPLGSIMGFIHLLKRDDITDEEERDFLERMENEISRMDDIIRALLDFARPTQTLPGPVNMNRLVEQALALVEVQKCFSGVEIVTRLDETLPSAMGQENRLIQVLLNLLSNAGQAMTDAGTMTITTAARNNEVSVAIADKGGGIDPEDLDKIFEPFFTRKEPGQGTGLGLAVSQSIVTALGGRIEVEVNPGVGSVFTIVLPIDPESDARNPDQVK